MLQGKALIAPLPGVVARGKGSGGNLKASPFLGNTDHHQPLSCALICAPSPTTTIISLPSSSTPPTSYLHHHPPNLFIFSSSFLLLPTMKRERPDISHTYTSLPPPPPPPPTMAPDLDDHSSRLRDAGDDELLAALGYKVRASDMADVAQKLEQLEMAMVTGGGDGGVGFQGYEDGLLSHFAVDTVHYNPADISNWLENMLSEINPSPSAPVATGDDESSTVTAVDFPGAAQIYDESDCDDLRAIPGELVFGGKQSVSDSSSATEDNKRQKTLPKQAQQIPAVVEPASRTMVLVDSQETGIRLVHTLMACAEAIQQDDVKAADALVTQISLLAAAQAGPMRKVATYFADALAHRIFYSRCYRRRPPPDSIDPAIADMLEMHFYETSPYLKFAHFTANQAILEAFAGKSRVHVIDFGMKQGMQWPALMQALALRPGGPPAFRLTGIGPPQPDNLDALQQVGWRLARLAETVGVEFEYRGYVAASLADLEPYMLDLRPEPEAVAVNSVFELHRLLARPGAAEKVLATVKALKPDIVTVVEQEADHNGAVFLDRFTEALHYYSTVFDSLEGGAGGGEEQVMAEMYVGRQIQNVVACEGAERVERHEMVRRWRARMEGAGFDAVHLGSNAFKQASMLLALFAGGDGYRVEEKDGCLMLGWHTRPLIVTSAWKPQPSPPQ